MNEHTDDGLPPGGMRSDSGPAQSHTLTDSIVRVFLNSNLSLILILLSAVLGLAALLVTPREEDPQIVVPLADVYVSFPGHSAAEVEQLVATPLEKLLYQIDGVEYVYSMSREGQAIITVRYYVGEDRERSLVKLFKQIDAHVDLVPPGVTGWVVKPVEIDDVPIVTLTLAKSDEATRRRSDGGNSGPRDRGIAGAREQGTGGGGPDEYTLRRVAEEVVERLAAVKNVSRAYVVGGQPRTAYVYLDPDRMQGYSMSPLEIQRAIGAANVTQMAGDFARNDELTRVDAGLALGRPEELRELVVGVSGDRPVFLKDVADVRDGPAEAVSYVRHGWGPARGFMHEASFPGTLVDRRDEGTEGRRDEGASLTDQGIKGSRDQGGATDSVSEPAVTIALAKKKGTNAVWVAQDVLNAAAKLKDDVVPDDINVVITRNYGLTANEKVNELVEALAVAIFIVIALLTLGLGWREALIVAVAVPVVFGLTLAVNLLFGYTINRVTLFALILSLGLLVDDPIVDVENITRHFALRRRASRAIVVEAVSEIRPPLITATLAVIVSFLPMFFITGMMGPYMRPMALNVPVTMIMSMVVAFTITPWLSYHLLRKHYRHGAAEPEAPARDQGSDEAAKRRSDEGTEPEAPARGQGSAGGQSKIQNPKSKIEDHDGEDLETLRKSRLYRAFYPLMAPLLHSRKAAWGFLGVMALLLVAAAGLAAVRAVPLKMLPFDNKNELLLVLDFDRGTTLERSDAAVREFEQYLATVPEVTDFTAYVGVASPIDFNGLVRHYYLRRGDNVAEVRVDLVGKKHRKYQSHALGLRLRDDLTRIAQAHTARLKIVELPPGPPVIATLTAEVRGRPDNTYEDLIAAAKTVRARMAQEPGVVDVDDTVEADSRKLVFVTDKEKAALNGVSVDEIAQTISTALGGAAAGTIRLPGERNPLLIELRLPRALRSSAADLALVHVKGNRPEVGGPAQLVPLAELGRWEEKLTDKTIYHKNLERIVYVFAETAGRTPAECVVDVEGDRKPFDTTELSHAEKVKTGAGWLADWEPPHTTSGRTFVHHTDVQPWAVPDGIRVDFSGEGEWNITLDVFRDLGLAFAAALVGIYILLVVQTGSFAIPVVVMMAIPLTVIGIMPGFWLLNVIAGGHAGGYADAILFTATGMIGMIALAGIVTRQAIIIVDFIHLSLQRGHSLFDAIFRSCVVRLRPILLTTGAAMLGAAPITIDPIFSGLAWALIFGLLASTVFTLFVIPVVYWLLYEHKPGHGLAVLGEAD